MTLISAVLGPGTLGIVLLLQARVAAFFEEGSFRSLSFLVLGATTGLSAGSALGPLIGKKFLRNERSPAAPPEHPSMLASVAKQAAQASPPNRPLLFLGLIAPLALALPLFALLLVTRQSSDNQIGAPAVLIGTSTVGSLLFGTAHGALPRTARGSNLRVLHWSLLLLCLFGGVIVTSHISSRVIGLNQLAAASILLIGTVSLLCFMGSELDRWQRPLAVAVLVLAVARSATYIYSQLDNVYERLTETTETDAGERFTHVLENRHGVVTITTSGWVHENGRVQGIFNTNPIPAADVNRCSRAYVIPSIVKEPGAILLLGLGSGSFAQILANHPSVKKLVILEENPAYEQAVKNSGIVASLLKNERVELQLGALDSTLPKLDKFDVIIQDRLPFRHGNHSEFVTKEFFQRLATHLNRGGAVYVNALGDLRIERTLLEAFPYLLRYQDMIFGSQERLRVDGYLWMRELMAWEIDGRKVLRTRRDPTEVARHVVQNRKFQGGFAWEREESIRERTKNSSALTSADVKTAWWDLKKLP